jgi:hypothetical protein
MGGFRTLFARLAERRGVAGRGAFEWTPEAERMRSALEMHELGVQLYRQRMATPVEAALRRAVADLNALKARWALIGGLAISVRSVPDSPRTWTSLWPLRTIPRPKTLCTG